MEFKVVLSAGSDMMADVAACAKQAINDFVAGTIKPKIAAMLEEAKTKIGAEGAVFPGCATVVDRDQG